ncbi:hypothetical protein [Streptomyces sp. B6B3]|uniref:hypothetical protein n=1 Tax=Streptomyces sp. B6B3 TaxID=3153570 RepID=UPI00325F50D4
MSPRTVIALALAPLLAPLAATAVPAAADPPSAFTIEDPRITESSGLQASSRHPGVYWTHNDSDPNGGSLPYVYAVDAQTGETLATITLEGVEARDVEAISIGPDGDLYVADIGDNTGGNWPEVWIYRFAEPQQLADATVTPTIYPVTYADGPRDAEALMVHPQTGRVYVAEKSDEGGTLYAAPESGLSESDVTTLEPVADLDLWVTDGAFSPDGTRLFLRGYFTSQMYRWEDDAPTPIEQQVPMPFQDQGESVTFTPDGGWLMFGTEGERSEVEPSELTGQLRPDHAEPRPDEEEDADGESGDDTDAAAGGSAGEDDGDGLSGSTVLILALAVVVIVGLRRLGLAGRRPSNE